MSRILRLIILFLNFYKCFFSLPFCVLFFFFNAVLLIQSGYSTYLFHQGFSFSHDVALSLYLGFSFIKVFLSLLVLPRILSLDIFLVVSSRSFLLSLCCFLSLSWILYLFISSNFFLLFWSCFVFSALTFFLVVSSRSFLLSWCCFVSLSWILYLVISSRFFLLFWCFFVFSALIFFSVVSSTLVRLSCCKSLVHIFPCSTFPFPSYW